MEHDEQKTESKSLSLIGVIVFNYSLSYLLLTILMIIKLIYVIYTSIDNDIDISLIIVLSISLLILIISFIIQFIKSNNCKKIDKLSKQDQEFIKLGETINVFSHWIYLSFAIVIIIELIYFICASIELDIALIVLLSLSILILLIGFFIDLLLNTSLITELEKKRQKLLKKT